VIRKKSRVQGLPGKTSRRILRDKREEGVPNPYDTTGRPTTLGRPSQPHTGRATGGDAL